MLLKKNFKGEETFTEFTHVGLGSNLVTLCPFFPKIMTTSRLHAFNVEFLLGGTTEMFPEEPVVMQVCHLSRPLSLQASMFNVYATASLLWLNVLLQEVNIHYTGGLTH